jgi:hypothetical protein
MASYLYSAGHAGSNASLSAGPFKTLDQSLPDDMMKTKAEGQSATIPEWVETWLPAQET